MQCPPWAEASVLAVQRMLRVHRLHTAGIMVLTQLGNSGPLCLAACPETSQTVLTAGASAIQ